MVVFPNCKINFGLSILQKREDGFHNLETIFYPVTWHDALEIVHSTENTSLTVTGFPTGAVADNLCLKAYYLLKKDYPVLPEIKMHLHKSIPTGSGLGGGSADAVFTLQLLNTKFNLAIPEIKLYDYAMLLGSDCPFFLLNKPCLGKGRGEILEQINLSLHGYKILLINPRIHINTAEAFSKVNPNDQGKSIKEIIQQPIQSWKDELFNDFEKVVFSKHPLLSKLKEELYNKGAVYASMSGSGSTIFGIFRKDFQVNYSPEPSFISKEIVFPESAHSF